MALNQTDKSLIRDRIKELKRWQYQRFSAETEAVIKRLKTWLQGDMPEPARPIMSKQEFIKNYGIATGGDNTKTVIVIDSKAMIDQMWPWLKTANVEIKTSQELREYFKNKLRNDKTVIR